MDGNPSGTSIQPLLDKLYRNYQENIENITDAATDEIETAVTRGDPGIKELVREYTNIASQLSSDYYQQVREAWRTTGIDMPPLDRYGLIDTDRVLWETRHGFADTDYNGVTYTQAKTGRNKAGVTLDDLWPSMSNVDDAQQFIADMISNSLRMQTMKDMRNDPSKPRWARVPQGRTCAFCAMLASRGFAYLSEETAGKDGVRYHAYCRCVVVPSWGRQTLDGYEPEEYRRMRAEAVKAAGKQAGEREILSTMREREREHLTDGVWRTSTPWPEEVIRPYARVWEHIMENHRYDAEVPNKTHFPAEWSEEKIKWAVKETICAPTQAYDVPGGAKKLLRRTIDDVAVEVYLRKKRNTHGKYAVQSAYPLTQQQRSKNGL